MLTEETLDDIGAGLENSPRKSLKRLVRETGVLRTSALRTKKALKLRPYKTNVVHDLMEHAQVTRIRFHNWFYTCRMEKLVDI